MIVYNTRNTIEYCEKRRTEVRPAEAHNPDQRLRPNGILKPNVTIAATASKTRWLTMMTAVATPVPTVGS